jgi:hypothetical protein
VKSDLKIRKERVVTGQIKDILGSRELQCEREKKNSLVHIWMIIPG